MKGSINSMVSPTAAPQPAMATASDFMATSVKASASTHTTMNVATRMTRRSRGISIAHLPQEPLELIDDVIHGVTRCFFPAARREHGRARSQREILELARKRGRIPGEHLARLQFAHNPRRVSFGNHGHDGTPRREIPVELAGDTALPP